MGMRQDLITIRWNTIQLKLQRCGCAQRPGEQICFCLLKCISLSWKKSVPLKKKKTPGLFDQSELTIIYCEVWYSLLQKYCTAVRLMNKRPGNVQVSTLKTLYPNNRECYTSEKFNVLSQCHFQTVLNMYVYTYCLPGFKCFHVIYDSDESIMHSHLIATGKGIWEGREYGPTIGDPT